MQAQDRTSDELIAPERYMGASPCGLADHQDFLLYISLADNTAAPWFKLFVFGELRLNNGGLLAAGLLAAG